MVAVDEDRQGLQPRLNRLQSSRIVGKSVGQTDVGKQQHLKIDNIWFIVRFCRNLKYPYRYFCDDIYKSVGNISLKYFYDMNIL